MSIMPCGSICHQKERLPRLLLALSYVASLPAFYLINRLLLASIDDQRIWIYAGAVALLYVAAANGMIAVVRKRAPFPMSPRRLAPVPFGVVIIGAGISVVLLLIAMLDGFSSGDNTAVFLAAFSLFMMWPLVSMALAGSDPWHADVWFAKFGLCIPSR